MPYVAPSTVVAGQTYSAASHNIIVNDIIDHEDRLDTVQNAQYPARNVLVNGAMQFAQRGSSITGITASQYGAADRWASFTQASIGTWTHAVSADAPTGSGFRNSLRVTCTTAITSLSATAAHYVTQRLEGQTLQHIKKGTSSAQPLTLQFWAKSNKTGTYVVELYDSDNTRQVSATYSIAVADTWEQKTVTFPADTTGSLDNDNAESMSLGFWLGAGSNYSSGTLNTTWNAVTTANRAVGQTNLAGVVGQYLAITGVQLEPGSQASPFEFVRYDDELLRCQRYYYRLVSDSTFGIFGTGKSSTTGTVTIYTPFPVTMRTVPASIDTSTVNTTFQAETGVTGVTSLTSIVINPFVTNRAFGAVDVAKTASFTVGAFYNLTGWNTATAFIGFSAEL